MVMVNLETLPVIDHHHLCRDLATRVGAFALLVSPEPVVFLWRDAISPLEECFALVTPSRLRMTFEPLAARI